MDAPTPQRIRASDTERQCVVDRPHHAFGEGRLDLAEAEQRVATAQRDPAHRVAYGEREAPGRLRN